MEDQIYLGNATGNAPPTAAGCRGHFKPAAGLRHSEDVEIKWGTYAPGCAIPEPGGADDRA
jgi:hypothetical protein